MILPFYSIDILRKVLIFCVNVWEFQMIHSHLILVFLLIQELNQGLSVSV